MADDLSVAAGEYDWLRLYFDEVVWPEASLVEQHVAERASGGRSVRIVDGTCTADEVARNTQQFISKVATLGPMPPVRV